MSYKSSGKSEWLLELFLDLLDPSRHFKWTTEQPKYTGWINIDGKKRRGVQLKSTTRKTLWIDLSHNSILKVRYSRTAKTRNKELALLQRELDQLKEDQVEAGERIAQEIDYLEERRGFATYDYEFTQQTFDRIRSN